MPDLTRRLLFVRAPASSNRIDGTDEQFVVTALLRRARNTGARAATDALVNRVGPALFSRKTDWNIARVHVLRHVRLSRAVVFFFELTRTHAVAAWLCRISGQRAPAPYRLALTPLYDAVVEVRFTERPTAAAIQGLRDVLESVNVFDPPLLLGSDVQVRVFDNHSASDVGGRVNLCFLISRPPGMSREACQRYWRVQHAQLAIDNLRYLRLTRYRQVHTMATPLAGLDDRYDGVVYAEKASLTQLLRDLLAIDTLRFNNTVVVDECRFTHATPFLLMRIMRAWS